MKQSQLFGKTIKEVPTSVSTKNHEFLYRGGFIRESVAGRYYFLPLGMRVHDKIIQIVEKEMDKTGAQKIVTPTLHQLELWKETNRTDTAGFELMTVKDRRGADF
ncbi:MAG: proline--tRNA ligase, partial [Patescibacteria group bacterium]